jgi:hypothetical protein
MRLHLFRKSLEDALRFPRGTGADRPFCQVLQERDGVLGANSFQHLDGAHGLQSVPFERHWFGRTKGGEQRLHAKADFQGWLFSEELAQRRLSLAAKFFRNRSLVF